MQDIVEEITFLQNLMMTMREGASDEKRMMLDALERRIGRKQALVDDFETLCEEDGA